MRTRLFAVFAILLIAGIAEAGISKAAQEWRRGPEKFIMTPEEEKAWKAVTTDAAAAAFIDLFWARRDPTVGTPRNEFREEFISRVRQSDAAFAEKRRRGALSERGQVYILIGPPEGGTRESMSIAGPSSMSSASARTADNVVWTWPREVAVGLGVPKLSATFNQIVGSDVYARDTKFGQFSNVSGTAIRKNVLHPEMTVAPEWAAHVGDEVLTATPGSTPPANAKATGRIGRLVLLSDLGGLNLDAESDPIAALKPETEFAADGDLAFVLEYCGSPGVLKLESKIGDLAAASEMELAPMKSLAGCGAIPGMTSLSGLSRGSHELVITTIEPSGGRLTTKQRFQIK